MLRKLETEGYIKKLKSSPKQIEDSIKLAERDLEVAKTVLDNDYDWTFNIAYNSILQSIRALIYKKGYRISSRNSHLATIRFAEIFLDEADVLYFDRRVENDIRQFMILREPFQKQKLKMRFQGQRL